MMFQIISSKKLMNGFHSSHIQTELNMEISHVEKGENSLGYLLIKNHILTFSVYSPLQAYKIHINHPHSQPYK